jgi:glyoxylase-like metal-dependent hydrolase (beta-lactamase superfamily II)
MAQSAKRLAQNAPGDFFVEASCIDCDACRQIGPATYADRGGQSSVRQQPANPAERLRALMALMALVACPTASIGTESHGSARVAVDAFPEPILENIHFCGFTAESSFGAWSYLLLRPKQGGNVLVDSPRFTSPLVRRIEQLGGIELMFLSHRDDIADHQRFAAHFRCDRVMHEADGAERLGIERVIGGEGPVRLDEDLFVVPTPGHTRGHEVLLYRDDVLFTGDHLAWSPKRETLIAFPDACWYSWPVQTRSMRKLLDYRFASVLPGHGRIHIGSADEMHVHLQQCVDWMETV